MKKIKPDFILFDLIGTTVTDNYPNGSLIRDSFHQAFHSNGIEIDDQTIKNERGKIKKEAIQNILTNTNSDLELTVKIYTDFMNLLTDALRYFSEIEGAGKLFKILKSKGIKIGLGSGLPLEFMKKVIEHVGWRPEIFDYLNSSENLSAGRPNPIMILDAMNQLNLKNKTAVLKIGDTKVDILEGKNAGVKTAGVLTGAMNRGDLEEMGADFILKNVTELNMHLKNYQ